MKRTSQKLLAALAILVGLAAAAIRSAAAQTETAPRLYTNEAYAEDVLRTTTLAIHDPIAVFKFVMSNLPDRVKVYPTENYYYFYFFHRHIRYAGNIRLDVTDRDEGKVHFVYYEDLTEWKYRDDPVTHLHLDRAQGVSVEKLTPFLYRISYGGKTVEFELKDISGSTAYHMHHSVFTVIDANHHTEDWTFMMKDKPIHAHFDLHRIN